MGKRPNVNVIPVSVTSLAAAVDRDYEASFAAVVSHTTQHPSLYRRRHSLLRSGCNIIVKERETIKREGNSLGSASTGCRHAFRLTPIPSSTRPSIFSSSLLDPVSLAHCSVVGSKPRVLSTSLTSRVVPMIVEKEVIMDGRPTYGYALSDCAWQKPLSQLESRIQTVNMHGALCW